MIKLMPRVVVTILSILFVTGHDLRRDVLNNITKEANLDDAKNTVDTGIEKESINIKDEYKNDDSNKTMELQNGADGKLLANIDEETTNENNVVPQEKARELLIVRTQASLSEILELLNKFSQPSINVVYENTGGSPIYGPTYGYVQGNINNINHNSSKANNSNAHIDLTVHNQNIPGNVNGDIKCSEPKEKQ